MGVKIVTVIRHLGGFVGYSTAKERCLAKKVEVWVESVKTLEGVARKHLQSTYAGL